MNPGGEPERDETGLPPVDIEIPDDARDLDRDVQAYRRELRAQRRTARQGRWHRSLGKDGVALPLLACCLVLALITGTLLTVFTATSNPNLGLPGSTTSAPAQPGTPAARLTPMRPLQRDAIALDGRYPLQVSTLERAMLVLIPPNCGNCAGTLDWLARVASSDYAHLYVIYTPTTEAEALDLGDNVPGGVQFAKDMDNALTTGKVKAGIPAQQLAAILIGPSGAATWASELNDQGNQTLMTQALAG